MSHNPQNKTPLTQSDISRMMSQEMKKHGEIRKGGHVRKLQSHFDKQKQPNGGNK
ncbi:hypothetical protein [Vibrio algivorus]|uniref:hypothetical protein n=1 Tax=Vibrio algivorus TaxID=1667024 RepID=UPI0016424373|nr:hypothetical protein [Vibrio algivorus]